MIKDILVVLTVTSAIVVIGLALFNRPARSQEIKPINPVLRNVVSSPKELRAILPPIEYDKPYDRVIIHEAKDIWAIRELCKLKSVITVACALLINGTCTIIKFSDQDIIRWGHNPEYVMRHEHGHCWSWGADHKGSRVPTPEDDARWKREYGMDALSRSK